jgi:hypothetical protein
MSKRIKIQTKWIVLLCLFAPLLSFIFIKPDWLARLAAVNGFSLVLTTLVFIYGLNPKSRMLGKRAYLHKVSDPKKKKIEYFMRGIVVLFGTGLLWFMIKPLAYDDIQFVRQGLAYAKNVDGSLATDNDTVRGMYFLYQGLTIKKDGQQAGNLYTAPFFTRFVYSGRKYHFIIAPKSNVVLDFQEVMPNTALEPTPTAP